MRHNHLTISDREIISKMVFSCFRPSAIAQKLNRNRSTISREIVRNSVGGQYLATQAQERSERRRVNSKSPWKMESPLLVKYVVEKMKLSWSPEQISARLKTDYSEDDQMRVSHECLYQWIADEKHQGNPLYLQLRQSNRKRRKRYGGRESRGQIRDRKNISLRPAIVTNRERIGDWESDTIEGKGKSGYVVTHVERKSRYLLAAVMPNKKAHNFSRATKRMFSKQALLPVETFTVDNGKEFADFKTIEAFFGAKVYFANPYRSWERGLNENTNGLLRQFIPKNTNLKNVTQKQIDKYVHLLNNRPRKCLGWRTPAEAIELATVAIQN
jgi:IS30 family transposase